MEFAHPPPVHLSNANMSIPPPLIGLQGNPLGPVSNQGMFNQKFEPRSGFNNTRPPFRPFLNLQRPLPGPLGNMTLEDFDGKRLRKSVMRKTVDYNSAIICALEVSDYLLLLVVPLLLIINYFCRIEYGNVIIGIEELSSQMLCIIQT